MKFPPLASKIFKEFALSAIFSIVFILLTACIASLNLGWLSDFCFLFHVYAFGVSFSGGNDTMSIIIYYLMLWVVITFLCFVMIRLSMLLLKK